MFIAHQKNLHHRRSEERKRSPGSSVKIVPLLRTAPEGFLCGAINMTLLTECMDNGTQGFNPASLFCVSLLQRDIINAKTSRQGDVIRSTELNTNGLTGKVTQVERPSQHVHARRTFVLITERCQRSQQCPTCVSHFNKQTVEYGRSSCMVPFV
jgi:hypothetical protein